MFWCVLWVELPHFPFINFIDQSIPIYFFISCVAGEKFVILDLPLLYESGVALYLMKDIIVVYWWGQNTTLS